MESRSESMSVEHERTVRSSHDAARWTHRTSTSELTAGLLRRHASSLLAHRRRHSWRRGEAAGEAAPTLPAKSRIQIQNPECGWRPECKGRATSKFRLQTWNPDLDSCNRAESESRIRSADGHAGGVVARRPPRRKTQNPESRSQAFCLLEFGSDVLHFHTCSTRYSADQACRIQVMRIQMDFARCHTWGRRRPPTAGPRGAPPAPRHPPTPPR